MKRAIFCVLAFAAQLSATMGCGQWGASVDWLYWKPACVAVDFGQVQTTETNVYTNQAVVDPTYESGVRGELWYRPECSPAVLMARYYWVQPEHQQTFRGDTGMIIAINAKLRTEYHAADFIFGYEFCRSSCFDLSLLFGGHFLYVAQPRQIVLTELFGEFPGVTRTQVHQRFSGGGASVGFAASWNFWCGMDAFAEARYGLLMGSRAIAQVSQADGNPSKAVTTPASEQAWTREVDLRLGVRNDWKCGCSKLGIQMGWEVRSYLDFAKSTIAVGETQSGAGIGMMIGGPFIGINGSF